MQQGRNICLLKMSKSLVLTTIHRQLDMIFNTKISFKKFPSIKKCLFRLRTNYVLICRNGIKVFILILCRNCTTSTCIAVR